MKNAEYFLGVDVGSVSTNIIAIDENNNVAEKIYIRTAGNPINAIKTGMAAIRIGLGNCTNILAVGTTGSGRQLASVIIGSDAVKNEITSHAVAALNYVPDAQTIFEIGGQDSKMIILRDGLVYDFAMNTVCAAGTGSFLDRQASRLGIPIQEFGEHALKSKNPVRIAGRCAVFAESDMIHKQQTGHCIEDILCGLCEALVRNYLNNLGKGKDIKAPIVFQGGVAANVGIVAAFEKAIGEKIIVPKNYEVMGALGVAIIARQQFIRGKAKTAFYGFDVLENEYKAQSLECNGCTNNCEIIEIFSNSTILARWGDRCGKWSYDCKQNITDNRINLE